MKAVIDRKIYDTETATLIGEAEHGYRSDLDHWWEALYRTPRGRFFVAGAGGPRSKYSQSLGNWETIGGAKIEPVSEREALAWCECHGVDPDTVAKFFSLEEA